MILEIKRIFASTGKAHGKHLYVNSLPGPLYNFTCHPNNIETNVKNEQAAVKDAFGQRRESTFRCEWQHKQSNPTGELHTQHNSRTSQRPVPQSSLPSYVNSVISPAVTSAWHTQNILNPHHLLIP